MERRTLIAALDLRRDIVFRAARDVGRAADRLARFVPARIVHAGVGRMRHQFVIGGMKLDEKFFVEFDGLRAHQLRLEGGDASSDSYCYSDAK